MAKKVKKTKSTKKKTAKKKDSPQKGEWLIKKSLIKEHVKSKGDYRISAETFEALSSLVRDVCDDAIERAEGNRRKTLQRQDF